MPNECASVLGCDVVLLHSCKFEAETGDSSRDLGVLHFSKCVGLRHLNRKKALLESLVDLDWSLKEKPSVHSMVSGILRS